MRRSSYRRAATRRGPDRRVIAAVAVLVAVGGVVGITQISNADENDIAKCATPAAAASAAAGGKAATDPKVGTYTDKDGDVQHKGDGQLAKGEQAPAPTPVADCKDGDTVKTTVNGLEILSNTCDDSGLEPHDGFQKGERCVSTEFGEVGDAAKNPTLLITESPETVGVGQPFTLKVSTRNLVRDRFLAAGQGGYYVERSVLTAEGLVRGHFHTACRMLQSTDEAPDAAPVPAFFVATEDRKGGAAPDTVTIQVPGLPQEGLAQCASWAGDGSHRVPMMQRANQTPGIDAVRVRVEAAGNGGDGDQGEGDQGGDGQGEGDQGGGDGGNDNGGGDQGNGGNDGGGQGDGDNGGDQGGNQPDPEPSAPNTNTGTTPPKTPTVTVPDDDETGAAPKPGKTTTAPATGNDAGIDNAGNNGGGNNGGGNNGGTGSGNDDAGDNGGSGDAGDNDSAGDQGGNDNAAGGSNGGTGNDAGAQEPGNTGGDEDGTPAQNVAGGATPKASKSSQAAAAGGNDDTGAPDDNQIETRTVDDTTVAGDVPSGNKLALTGANVMAASLGGLVLVLGGFLILSVTRRRRAEQQD